MKPNLKACGHALATALVNATLAVALMLLVEFAILVIGVVIFIAQFWRQRHLCRTSEQSGNVQQP
jgi:Flp pilus assembly protein TadB